MSTRNYIDKLRRYFWFSQEEWLNFIVAVIGISLIYSWTDWGVDKFDLIYGLKNFAIALVLIGITVFVHHAGQRMMAISLGMRAEQKIWWNGLMIGLMIVILTGGKIKFLAATATIAYMLPIHRLGTFRYGPNVTTVAKTVLAGPLLNIFFSAIVKTIEWMGIISPSLGQEIFVLNLAFAGWNLIPIPPLDGSKVFYASRLWYAFIFGSIVSYVGMVYFLNFYSYIVALLIGGIVWLSYYIFFESKWGL